MNAKRYLVISVVFGGILVVMSAHAQTAISTDGVVESKEGGFKFPDESMQTTAAPTLHDIGVFYGSVGLTYNANFSLLPIAGGKTGVAAADAQCNFEFPGSHAELNVMRLWEAAIVGDLPQNSTATQLAFGYWASGQDYPPIIVKLTACENDLNNPFCVPNISWRRTTDCQGWTLETNTGPTTDRPGYIRVTSSVFPLTPDIGLSGCAATNLAIACFGPPL